MCVNFEPEVWKRILDARQKSSFQHLSRSVVRDGSGLAGTVSGSGGEGGGSVGASFSGRLVPAAGPLAIPVSGGDYLFGLEFGHGRIVSTNGCPELGFGY